MFLRILVVLAGAMFTAAAAFADHAEPVAAHVPTVLVTGANRGIGLELTRQYAARGAQVIATARDPAHADQLKALAADNPRVSIEQLDVGDLAQIRALAVKYAKTPIDILINNAGVSGGMQNQMFGKMDYAVFEDVLRVNTIAPLAISEAFMPSILAGQDKRIVAISSSEGSVGLVTGPRLYFMRASKAALNMEMRTLAFQLKSKGVSIAILNPGMVDTDFMKGLPKNMLRPVADAARDLIRNIDGMTIENTGSFINYDGATLPW